MSSPWPASTFDRPRGKKKLKGPRTYKNMKLTKLLLRLDTKQECLPQANTYNNLQLMCINVSNSFLLFLLSI